MKLPLVEEGKLEDLKIEFERFFEVSLDMLCISSYDGHFKKVNPSFTEVLGFSSEELCTKSYLDFIHPDDIEPTIKEVERQFKFKQQVFNFENRYRCRDGTYKWLSWKSAPVGNFMYAVARDMTESRNIKEALEIANRDLEAFSYSVAHDLRAPVRSMVGFSTLILEDAESTLGETAKSHLNRVINAGNRMGALIDGLLNLSRLAKKNLVKNPFCLSTAILEIAQDLKMAEPQRKVHFIIAPDTTVEGDGVLLKAVLHNLIGNAWKYTSRLDHDAIIEFGITREGATPIFFIKDNGVGFEMKYVNRLFGVFQRLHSSEEFQGTGVGLVTAQRIIQRHGGRIWVEAEVNKGATFYFTLPS